MSGESVKVFCRFRPFNAREKELGADKGVNLKIGKEKITIGDATGEPRDFPFDYAFDWTTTQALVYEQCAQRSVEDIFSGYNGTIFAYGQTGAGKSWSMMGNKTDPELRGIIPRAAESIFERISQEAAGTEYEVCTVAWFLFLAWLC